MDNKEQMALEKQYNFSKIQKLKCGANPHQNASLYHYDKEIDWEILKGACLTYNNIIDSSLALEVISEFFDVAAIGVINCGNINSCALGIDINNAWDKIIDSDPTCYFKGTIISTREITLDFAKKISPLEIKLLIAPCFSDNAILELNKNKNLKIIKINTPLEQILKFNEEEIKLTPFGALIQEKDTKELEAATFKVVTKKKPLQNEVEDMIFAFKIAKHVKSAGIVIAKDLRTLAISSGEADRVKSVQNAVNKVCDSLKDSILASDGFLLTKDTVQIAAQNRISGIIQPMGALKDDEIIKECDKYNISMISTGIRHIKH